MAITNSEYRRMANDPKFVAARWKQRVAVSAKQLDKTLASNKSQKEKDSEFLMHKNRMKKCEEVQRKVK